MRVNAFGLAAGWKLCEMMRLSGFTHMIFRGSKLEAEKVKVDVGKWLELLKEIAPATRQVLYVYDPKTGSFGRTSLLQAFEDGAGLWALRQSMLRSSA